MVTNWAPNHPKLKILPFFLNLSFWYLYPSNYSLHVFILIFTWDISERTILHRERNWKSIYRFYQANDWRMWTQNKFNELLILVYKKEGEEIPKVWQTYQKRYVFDMLIAFKLFFKPVDWVIMFLDEQCHQRLAIRPLQSVPPSSVCLPGFGDLNQLTSFLRWKKQQHEEHDFFNLVWKFNFRTFVCWWEW